MFKLPGNCFTWVSVDEYDSLYGKWRLWFSYIDNVDIDEDYMDAKTISELRSVLKKVVEWIAQH
jgi:hypothetical protein